MKLFWLLAFFATVAQAALPQHCRTYIKNQGYVPDKFYDEVFETIKAMPDDVFARNPYNDIYSLMSAKLGPFETIAERRAVMVHVVSSMAGQESTWRWNIGRDPGANNTSWDTQETGAFQTSCNIRNFNPGLTTLIVSSCEDYSGSVCQKFVKCTKGNHRFAIETVARALRFEKNGVPAYRHWGPLRRHEVTPFLTKACVAAIEARL